MNATIADDIRADAALDATVRSANEVVDRYFSAVSAAPAVTWRRSVLQPERVELELQESSDHRDYIARDFSVDQLRDAREFRSAVSALWGELLVLAYRHSSDRLVDVLRDLRKAEESREMQLQGA